MVFKKKIEGQPNLEKIGFGGGCHWCTEAVFQSLKGVAKVEQGFVASTNENAAYSEAVIVHYDKTTISLNTLIEIHLHTHKSNTKHSRRDKYRSAIYTFTDAQSRESEALLSAFQNDFKDRLITKVMPFRAFQPSRDELANYYYKNPKKPFCQTFIDPKLKLLHHQFSDQVDAKKLKHFTSTSHN